MGPQAPCPPAAVSGLSLPRKLWCIPGCVAGAQWSLRWGPCREAIGGCGLLQAVIRGQGKGGRGGATSGCWKGAPLGEGRSLPPDSRCLFLVSGASATPAPSLGGTAGCTHPWDVCGSTSLLGPVPVRMLALRWPGDAGTFLLRESSPHGECSAPWQVPSAVTQKIAAAGAVPVPGGRPQGLVGGRNEATPSADQESSSAPPSQARPLTPPGAG